MPTENIIIGIKEVDNIIVYNLKSSKTGFEQDVYEKDCFPTRQEAKEYNKPNYNELEKSHILLIEELDKAKKQIGDMNNYIKSLQEIINSLQKKE